MKSIVWVPFGEEEEAAGVSDTFGVIFSCAAFRIRRSLISFPSCWSSFIRRRMTATWRKERSPFVLLRGVKSASRWESNV